MSEDESMASSGEEDYKIGSGLKALSQNDPDFYKYLEENDKDMLDFDDEEDSEDDDDQETKKTTAKKVTEDTLNDWCEKLRNASGNSSSIGIIKNMMEVFRVSVANAAGDDKFQSSFKLAPDLFNSICKIAFTEMTPGLFKLLFLPVPGSEAAAGKDKTRDVTKCKNWSAISSPVKKYLISLIEVLNVVSEESVVCSLLRHSLHMVPFIQVHIPVFKKFLNRVINLWSSSQEKVRVLSFLCVLRLIRDRDQQFVDYALKKMYLSFAKNSKLTTTESMPMISFMQQSLVELYTLDQSVAYNHTFVFLRQCAITLRNAMSKPIKDNLRMVFCWPYVHSLVLWQRILCCLHPSDVMKPLIFPLVQVMTGVLKLSSSAQFEPLRFHIIKAMVKLSQTTEVFIPVIPFVVNILERIHYPTHSKKNKTGDEKRVDFNCLLRVKDTEDNWYRNAIVRNSYEVLLDYFASQSHRIGFPELAFPPVFRIKKFLKEKCKNPEDHRLLKQVVDKIEENSKFITDKRTSVTFKFSDSGAVEVWENERHSEGTPLMTFQSKYNTLRKESEKRELKQIRADIQEKKKRKQLKKDLDDEDRQDHAGDRPLPNSTSLPKKKVKKLKPSHDSFQDIELKGLEISDEED